MRRLSADRLESASRPTVLGRSELPSHAPETPTVDPSAVLKAQQEKLFEQARVQGYAKGMSEAEREIALGVDEVASRLHQDHDAAVAKLRAKEERLRLLLLSLQAALDAHAEKAETMAVEVAFASVTRLLGEKSADRSLMLELCRAVIREYGNPPATLRLSEADLSLIEANQLDIPVEVDRRLAPGQCVIDTARGQFETGLDIRLAALSKALLTAIAEHRGPA